MLRNRPSRLRSPAGSSHDGHLRPGPRGTGGRRLPWLVAALVALAGLGKAKAQTGTPGKVHWGTSHYVEYVEGNLPIIISAPHGGYIKAKSIPNRSYGVVNQDRRTQELARALAAELRRRTGREPHLVVSHLHRVKLDPNREIKEAAQGNKEAEQAWREFHAFVEKASDSVTKSFGFGHCYDMHGHAHPIPWVEIGYALSASELNLSDSRLQHPSYRDKSTIRAVAARQLVAFPAILRGVDSLGGQLQAKGVLCVPSPKHPGPGKQKYFNGGYNVRRHGSRDGGVIDATQLEHPWSIRQSSRTHAPYVIQLADAIEVFFKKWYRYDLRSGERVGVQVLERWASEGGRRAKLRVWRSGGQLGARDIALDVGGTAKPGSDYRALATTVRFAAQQRFVDLDVVPFDDKAVEGNESIVVRLRGGRELTAPNSAELVLHDDEGHAQHAFSLGLETIKNGKSLDESGNHRNAQVIGSAQVVPARHGRGVAFDGSKQALRIADFAYAQSGEFSLSFWFRGRAKTSSGYRYLVSHGNYGQPSSLSVYFAEGSKTLRTHLVFGNAQVENNPLDVAVDVLDDKWHHYCLIVRPRRFSEVWLDGTRRAQSVHAGDRFDPSGDLWFASRSDRSVSRYFLGTLDEVGLWSRALAPAEVSALHAWRAGRVETVGPGCIGSAGSAHHEIDGRPELGLRRKLFLDRSPAATPCILGLGSSSRNWNQLPLPFHLDALGARGCALRISLDAMIALVSDAQGQVIVEFPSPLEPKLIGARLHTQFVIYDPKGNSLGITLSNAQRHVFGGVR